MHKRIHLTDYSQRDFNLDDDDLFVISRYRTLHLFMASYILSKNRQVAVPSMPIGFEFWAERRRHVATKKSVRQLSFRLNKPAALRSERFHAYK